ncbi:hypothetical protein KTE26_14265 [Ralstonia mannitolilytica]|uniref:hypothetical protein n=1 Tax=Ralstonia mannitolilytica TaxID=105219 RepID=UPI001C22B89A|nr:hypothetical protein [Ralstonia mannitolilytica]MBU9579595.1 hypothetical protein [Ralstonia mannitolilytica]
MTRDPELEFVLAQAAFAPLLAMERAVHAFEVAMLKADLAAAKQDAQMARNDATNWRLRAQYSERRLVELTQENK